MKLQYIKFGKTDMFKCLESIIPKNDNCDVRSGRRFKQVSGWEKRLQQKYLIKKILAKTSGKVLKSAKCVMEVVKDFIKSA